MFCSRGELKALKEGLIFVKQLGMKRLLLLTDSMDVVSAISSTKTYFGSAVCYFR